MRLVYKSIVSSELMQYLKPKLQFFASAILWQAGKIRCSNLVFKNCTDDTIVLVIDFAKNYSFEIQNEMQSMHWHNYQVTILVHITWVKNRRPNLHDERNKTLMKYYFYVYDDKSHNSYFVQDYLILHYEDVVNSGNRPSQHRIWPNGCSSQFKSKVPWYFVSCYFHMIGGYICLWIFFGSDHGKGPHDGIGVMLKPFIRQV